MTNAILHELNPDAHSASDEYAARFSSNVGRWMLSVQDEALLEILSEQNGKTVLDVGGGHGQIALPLVVNNYQCTVQGSSEECKLQIADLVQDGKVKFVVSDLFHQPFKDGEFEVVTCFRILSHVENWKGLIAELCRLSSGMVAIDYPTLCSFNVLSPLLFKIKKRIEGNTRTFSVFRKSEIVEEFKKNGFELSAHYGQFFWPMGIHRLFNNPKLANLLEKFTLMCGLNNVFGTPVVASFNKIKR